MEYRTLLMAGFRRHKGGLAGVFILIFLVALSLGSVLTVWSNSGRYVAAELKRAGYGSLTAWVSGLADPKPLTDELAALPQVRAAEAQELIYANYTVNEQESDSEGQLITLAAGETRYRFFTGDLSGYQDVAPRIAPGEVYVSPSLVSMFGVEPGDVVTFSIARAGGDTKLTVKGFYEDPFMGSSMIGMKGFLICQADHDAVTRIIQSSGIDALARNGAMLHIFPDGSLSASSLSGVVNGNTSLPAYTEFVHSESAVSGFMLILQNAFSALLLAFVLVLLCAVFAVLGHSVGSAIEADSVNMGILKTVGMTSAALRRAQLLQYGAAILSGMALGMALTPPVSRAVSGATLTTTGILVPADVPVALCLGAYLATGLLLAAFIALRTAAIGRIAPMRAIRGEAAGYSARTRWLPAIRGTHLSLRLAARKVFTEKRKYAGACAVALLLVFFASMVGRVDAWLGPDGKGMMDAFNPADHDIGAQTFGTLSEAEAEAVVLRFTDITDRYLLAMPGVSVNGVDCTANVISEPERFHILAGRTCAADDEIVITETIAADLNAAVGDTLTVTGDSGSGEYVVCGIYSCANDMGANVGLSRAGYLKIGRDDPMLWCHHYFLADPTLKSAVAEALETAYGGDIHIHENTWPGLFGILSAMGALVTFMNFMVAAFILVVTVMTGGRLLAAERQDIGIYKAIGFTDGRLRLSFALRFGMTALTGASLGAVLATAFTDPIVSGVMKLAGISSFASHPGLGDALAPVLMVTALFAAFAYLAARSVRKTDLTMLIAE